MREKQGGNFLYRRIEEECRARIASGEWPSGFRLPSEVELAANYGCNFHTVRRALALLVKDNLIERHKGRGSYVLGGDFSRTAARSGAVVGVLLQMSPENDYLYNLLNRLHSAANASGVKLNIRAVETIGPENLPAVSELEKQGCASVIVPWYAGETRLGRIALLASGASLPLVLPQPLPGYEENFYRKPELYESDSRTAIRISCEYFYGRGFRKIAFLGNGRTGELFAEKLMEYTRFVNRHGLPDFAFIADNDAEYESAVKFFSPHRGSIAVICNFDAMAVNFCRTAQNMGFSIPRDFSVLGYNNSRGGLEMTPRLSTIQCPCDDIARAMLEHAVALGRNELAQSDRLYPAELIIRESCADCASEAAENGRCSQTPPTK